MSKDLDGFAFLTVYNSCLTSWFYSLYSNLGRYLIAQTSEMSFGPQLNSLHFHRAATAAAEVPSSCSSSRQWLCCHFAWCPWLSLTLEEDSITLYSSFCDDWKVIPCRRHLWMSMWDDVCVLLITFAVGFVSCIFLGAENALGHFFFGVKALCSPLSPCISVLFLISLSLSA